MGLASSFFRDQVELLKTLAVVEALTLAAVDALTLVTEATSALVTVEA